MSYPLLNGFAPDAAVGWRDGTPVSLERFLGVAAALARRLPQGGHCINACEDRLNFLSAFAAAMMAGSVTLLPQSRAPGALKDLDGMLVDDAVVGDWNARFETIDVPSFAAAQPALILFTSGTTGTPQPHAKSWGSLVAGARALRDRTGLAAGAAIVGAVPPPHMWGREPTVLLAMQSGCAVDASCPLLPAEIAAALAKVPAPRWLVATPAHLRACALSGERLPVTAGMLCSTAALPEETARSAEALGGCAVLEIYGSTETVAIATRRTAVTQEFEALAGIEIAIAQERAVARGSQLEAAVELNDVLQAAGGARFTVQGRAADLVKVGGKRSSLGALTAELNRIPGVVDGVFWLPEASQSRVAAFAVAPGLAKGAILEHLRERVDPVFLPRPLLLVDSLPRNAAGKLSRASLEALASEWQSVPASHPALPGHFPGNPVVPGAWLLELVERAARRRYGEGIELLGLPAASFRAPLRPEDRFRIVLERTSRDRVAFRIEGEEALVADGTLLMREALEDTP